MLHSIFALHEATQTHGHLTMLNTDNLSFSRFRAYFRVQKKTELPSYSGSTFRGILGHTMRKVRYGMRPENCPDCPVRSDCRYGNLYAYLFESPWDHPFIAKSEQSQNKRKEKQYPQPFILEPPPGGSYVPGEFLPLSFTLVGKAIELFPFMACALALTETRRLGRDGKVVLEGITDGFPSEDGSEVLIYDGKTGVIVGPGQILDFHLIEQWVRHTSDAEGETDHLRVRFLTPFRFRKENRLGRKPDFNVFMRNVFRRLIFLSIHSPLSFEIDVPKLLERTGEIHTNPYGLRWHDWQRYSDRQKGRMKLGGFLGDIVFSGPLDEFMPYIRLCEFLNVGKNVSFGLGRFETEMVNCEL